MLTTTATLLTALIAVALVLMGAQALRAPQAAAGFGIPDTPTEDAAFRSWLAVKAVRDVACGLLVAVLLAAAEPRLLGLLVLTAAVIPAGDAVIVLRSGGPRAAAYGIHGATAAVMLAVALILLVA